MNKIRYTIFIMAMMFVSLVALATYPFHLIYKKAWGRILN
jgi:hypothetical protein